jgi:hypothetical protein
MIKKLDTTHNPLVLLTYEGNTQDSSGNGYHLTGTAVFRKVFENCTGLVSGALTRGVHDAALRDLDDKTIQVILVMRTVPANAYVCSFAASGETEAANYTMGLRITNQDGLYCFWENGAGLDVSYAVSTPLPALGVPFHLAMRIRAGVVQFFLNGLPVGAPSAPLTLPTGGTVSQLLVNNSGTGFPEQLCLKINGEALTDAQIRAEYNRTLGEGFGRLENKIVSKWIGAVTSTGVTIAAKLLYPEDSVQLFIDDLSHGSPVSASDCYVKLTATGLNSGESYQYEFEADAYYIDLSFGSFSTLETNAQNFAVTFAGDASNGSNHQVFEAIADQEPTMHIHLGDAHYSNISTNSPALFQAAFDEMLVSPNQGGLYGSVPTAYVWDDHDYGANNSDGTSASKTAAAAVYRSRVPHYPLPDSVGIWQTWDIGRVRFVMTDQRSHASPNSANDDASKSMLGSTQKTWFKNLLSNSAGKLIVWICPRMFGGVATAGADHWGGFTTERAELVAHINSVCPGRVIVLSADAHCGAIDDGTSHWGLPTFQAAPLDRTPDAVVYGGATYSEGWFNNNGQFGLMDIADDGTDIEVSWYLYDSTGSQLLSYTFTVTP